MSDRSYAAEESGGSASSPATATGGSGGTTSTAFRWAYTNDLLAFVLIAATVGAVAYSLHVTGRVPQRLSLVFAAESVLAATWAFGPATLRVVATVLPFLDPPGGGGAESGESGAQSNGSA